MLITTQRMKCHGEWVEPGKPVPNVTKWDAVALQSCINIGWIREATPEEEAAIAGVPQSKPAVPVEAKSENFLCSKCPKGFKSQSQLKRHNTQAHKD